MGLKIANQAYGILSAGISAGATAIALQTGHGARFGAFGATDYMYLTLINPSNQIEVILCKGRSGDSLTPVARGQDGTTALAFSAGDRVECRPCNAAMLAMIQEASKAVALTTADGGQNYIGTLAPAPNGYNTDQLYTCTFPAANLAAPLINLNAMGAVAIKGPGAVALSANDIPAGHTGLLRYDGTQMIILNLPVKIPAGTTAMFAGTAAPAGWLERDGSAVSRTVYAALFSAIGTTYGAGDGTTTFNLPNSAGRTAIGRNAQTFSTTVTADASTDVLTAPANEHLYTGTKVRATTTGGLPAPLAGATDYYWIQLTPTTGKLATSLANAQNGVAIDITTAGTGIHTLSLFGTTSRAVGASGGQETHAMDINELLAHHHSSFQSGGGFAAFSNIAGPGQTGDTGGNKAMNVMNPFEVFMPIIKY